MRLPSTASPAANLAAQSAEQLSLAAVPLVAVLVIGSGAVAGAVALLVRIVEPPRPAPPDRHPLREMRDGAQFVWRHEHLRPMVLAGVAWNISWFVLQAAYIPHAARAFGLGAEAGCQAGLLRCRHAFRPRHPVRRGHLGVRGRRGPRGRGVPHGECGCAAGGRSLGGVVGAA